MTLSALNSSSAVPRIDILVDRAAVRECDFIVKGNVKGKQRGWVRLSDGRFLSDRKSEGLINRQQLQDLAQMSGQELTFTCVPPGSGKRMGIDRDEDGHFDTDELDAGNDPDDP